MEEEREVCPSCGHLMSECRDPKTAGTWTVETEICQASRVAQAVAEDKDGKARGVHYLTRRTEGHG